MLVESIIRRPEGTTVSFDDGVSFSFQPDDTGRHVCEIPDRSPHLARLLEIREGYRPAPRPTVSSAEPAQQQAEQGQSIGGEGDGGGDQTKQQQGDTTQPASPDPAAELEAARAAFSQKFGKAPHPRMSLANLLKAVAAEAKE